MQPVLNSIQFFYTMILPTEVEMEWEELVRMEPRLATLLKEVKTADSRATRSFCGVTAWHGSGGRPGFKMRAFRLAGFGCFNPELRTREAYETAMEKLYSSFPPCRGCACVAEEEVECA
jgi:hypothetical protein